MRGVWLYAFVLLGSLKAFGQGIWWGLGWLALCGLVELAYRWLVDRAE